MAQYINFSPTNEQIMEHLRFENPTYYQAFRLPMASDGMSVVGRSGRAIGKYYLLTQWHQNKVPGNVISNAAKQKFNTIWQMSYDARKATEECWKQELLAESVEKLARILREYDLVQQKVKKLRKSGDGKIIAEKRIVACTTTGAAMYADELRLAPCQVMLVEEAEEILESHALTALGEETDQLILIDDYKQLCPRYKNYEISVEKGEGYDFNPSLFERLVLKGFPHQSLSMQHRMRPEISNLICGLQTYTHLEDDPGTKNRPDIRSFQDNIVFVTNELPEDENKDIGSPIDGNSHKSSKQQF